MTYEALIQLIWEGLQEWLESYRSEDLCKLNNTTHTLYNIHEKACHSSLTAAMIDDSCIIILTCSSGCFVPKEWPAGKVLDDVH